MRPAATRSSAKLLTSANVAKSVVTSTAATSARMESLAVDLALRTAAMAVEARSRAEASPGVPRETGHGARCTDPDCHQDHTSSVTYGRYGANSRSRVESPVRRATR